MSDGREAGQSEVDGDTGAGAGDGEVWSTELHVVLQHSEQIYYITDLYPAHAVAANCAISYSLPQ